MGRPSTVIVAGVAALALDSTGRARRAAGAGSRGLGGALAAGVVYCSRSLNWRAKLIAAARARRVAGAGSRGRGGTLAARVVYCSRSSNWRAKLIAAARDWGFWIWTSMLSGGWRPPVNS
jgi:hypothetical protein